MPVYNYLVTIDSMGDTVSKEQVKLVLHEELYKELGNGEFLHIYPEVNVQEIPKEFLEYDIFEDKYTVTKKMKLNLRSGLREDKEEINIGDRCRIKGLNEPVLICSTPNSFVQMPNHSPNRSYSEVYYLGKDNAIIKMIVEKDLLEKIEEKKEEVRSEKSSLERNYSINLDDFARTNREFRYAIVNGRKIEAIKSVRNEFGLGLKEAKDLVESITNNRISGWKILYSIE